ncbi:MAG: ABC transporter permease [Candidatus Melainabacteria bacterium]|nr:ABC transporter permease [Candidatus Melainabacteria bacterium]
MRIALIRIIFFLVLFLIWYLIVSIGHVPSYIVPSPVLVLDSFYHGFMKGGYLLAIYSSLIRVLTGYFLALSVGIITGILLARYYLLDITFGKIILALQSIPSVAWVPLALLWFGVTDNAVIFIIILEAVLPVALSTKNAMKNIQPNLIRAAQTLGSRGLHLYKNVIIKAMIPELVTGLRLSWAFAWRALIAGELFISGTGIGQTLELGRSLADMAQVMAMIITIGVIGFLTENIFFGSIEKKVRLAWGLEGGN